jgi:hypothetical protein
MKFNGNVPFAGRDAHLTRIGWMNRFGLIQIIR